MSDATSEAQKDGPAMPDDVLEVQGHFGSDAAIQDALSRLTLAGYDRADFSIPDDREALMETPNEGAENPLDDTDKAQLRTMGSSLAGVAGAIAAAGVTVATGGAALAAGAAAAAIGGGSALAVNAAGGALSRAKADEHDARGREGTLILAVRTTSAAEVTEVEGLLREAGATEVKPVARGGSALTAGVSSAGWTGA